MIQKPEHNASNRDILLEISEVLKIKIKNEPMKPLLPKMKIKIEINNKIKRFYLAHYEDKEKRVTIQRFYKIASHKNFMKYFGIIEFQNYHFFVFENLVCPVRDLIGQNLKFFIPLIKIVCYQILKVLHYFELRKIFHRNINPDTVMISETGLTKLRSFGYFFDTESIKSGVTTLNEPYAAPEILNNQKNVDKGDIFSFGLLAYEMYYGKKFHCVGINIFKTLKNLVYRLQEFNLDSNGQNHDEILFKQFLRMCLKLNQEKRATAEDLLSHDWLNEIHSLNQSNKLLKTARKYLKKISKNRCL